MEDCTFCKIIKGEIPAFKIYEDKTAVAFLDLSQYTKGHTLIIPKNHQRWLWDHNEKEYCHIMKVSRKIANIMRKVYSIEWVEMIVAGMGVEHTHIHIIPRYPGDGHKEIPLEETKVKNFSKEELADIAEELKNAVDKYKKEVK